MARLMIYDQTTLEDGLQKEDALAYSWRLGGKLYRKFRALDIVKGVSSWEEAFDWIISEGKKEQISSIQFWGHGSPGVAWIGRQPFTSASFSPGGNMHDKLNELRPYLSEFCQIWFRTCGTMAGQVGHEFAVKLSNLLDCSVAGHTYIIALWQSGLHLLRPGRTPDWPVDEGFDPSDRSKLKWSSAFAPNTISCLRGSVPKAFHT